MRYVCIIFALSCVSVWRFESGSFFPFLCTSVYGLTESFNFNFAFKNITNVRYLSVVYKNLGSFLLFLFIYKSQLKKLSA
jgi:hypothetical protein